MYTGIWFGEFGSVGCREVRMRTFLVLNAIQFVGLVQHMRCIEGRVGKRTGRLAGSVYVGCAVKRGSGLIVCME